MNRKFTTSCLVAGVLSLGMAGCTTNNDVDLHSTKVYVKDSVITTKVKAQLAEEKLVSLVHISVDTDRNGVVYLSGTAGSQMAIDKAVSITRNVGGVTDVHSDVRIRAE
jgi:hyperosmotically inducible protein